ncbi:hypothetical protein GCM10027049_22010 [Mucilaginibacter puniceus]
MKNYLLPIILVALFTSCHLKKKTSKINTIDRQTVLNTTEGVRTQTNLKVIRIDSSKIVKSSIDNLDYSESVNMEFDLIPTKEKSILIPYKNNVTLFEQILDKSQKVKIHINRIQQKSNSQLLARQNNIKSKIDSGASYDGIYKQTQKINIKEKNRLSSESKTSTPLTWWIIATVYILITVYILKKFNIFTLIASFFKL